MVHHQHWPSAPNDLTSLDHHPGPTMITMGQASSAPLSPWWQHLKWHRGCTSAVHHWGCREKCRSGDHNFMAVIGTFEALEIPWNPGHGFSSSEGILQNLPQHVPASEDQTHPTAEGHLDHLEPGGIHGIWAMLDLPAAGGAEHKASCQKRDFASSTQPGGSTWDLVPWSDEKYLVNGFSYYGCSEWLQTLLIHVTIEIYWNSGVRVERTQKNCRRIDDEVGGTSIDQRSDRWPSTLVITGRPRQITLW